jgi:hypothetical protein
MAVGIDQFDGTGALGTGHRIGRPTSPDRQFLPVAGSNPGRVDRSSARYPAEEPRASAVAGLRPQRDDTTFISRSLLIRHPIPIAQIETVDDRSALLGKTIEN